MKTRSITLSLVTLAFLIVLVQACKHEPLPIIPDTGGGGTGGGGTTDTMVCFETQVFPILNSNCAMDGCHSAIKPKDGYAMNNYAAIMRKVKAGNPNGSDMYTSIATNFMPEGKPPLSDADKAIIYKWIAQGAKDITGCGSSGCDTTLFAYKANIEPIINSQCKGCHSGPTPSGAIDLSTVAAVQKAAKNGSLYGSVAYTGTYSHMPKGGTQLPACQLRIIQKWVDAGAPNN